MLEQNLWNSDSKGLLKNILLFSGLLPKTSPLDEISACAPDNDKNAQALSQEICDQQVGDCCSDKFYKVQEIDI